VAVGMRVRCFLRVGVLVRRCMDVPVLVAVRRLVAVLMPPVGVLMAMLVPAFQRRIVRRDAQKGSVPRVRTVDHHLDEPQTLGVPTQPTLRLPGLDVVPGDPPLVGVPIQRPPVLNWGNAAIARVSGTGGDASLGHPGALFGAESNLYYLGQPVLAMGSVIAVHVWRLTPLSAVIMMAGLVAIPRDLEEAAKVDGAGYWRRMFEITIPMVLPVAAVAALFGAIFTFTDMAVVDVLTNGGPNNATQVLTSWAFFRGIDGGDVGQGAAIALFLFPILLAAAIAILRAVRRMEIR